LLTLNPLSSTGMALTFIILVSFSSSFGVGITIGFQIVGQELDVGLILLQGLEFGAGEDLLQLVGGLLVEVLFRREFHLELDVQVPVRERVLVERHPLPLDDLHRVGADHLARGRSDDHLGPV